MLVAEETRVMMCNLAIRSHSATTDSVVRFRINTPVLARYAGRAGWARDYSCFAQCDQPELELEEDAFALLDLKILRSLVYHLLG